MRIVRRVATVLLTLLFLVRAGEAVACSCDEAEEAARSARYASGAQKDALKSTYLSNLKEFLSGSVGSGKASRYQARALQVAAVGESAFQFEGVTLTRAAHIHLYATASGLGQMTRGAGLWVPAGTRISFHDDAGSGLALMRLAHSKRKEFIGWTRTDSLVLRSLELFRRVGFA